MLLLEPNIDERHEGFYISGLESNEKLYVGDRLHLECYAVIYKKFIKITWFKDGRFIKFSERIKKEKVERKYSLRYSLTIENVTLVDSGNYSCRAALNYDSESDEEINEDRELRVDVVELSKPTVKFEILHKTSNSVGDKIALKCVASGAPEPVLMWLKKENNTFSELIATPRKIFKDKKSIFVISYLRPEDSSDYKCVGENRFGKDEKVFKLKVNGKVF